MWTIVQFGGPLHKKQDMGLGVKPTELDCRGGYIPVEAAGLKEAISLTLATLLSPPPKFENLDFAPPILVCPSLTLLLAFMFTKDEVLLAELSSKV